MRQTVGADLEFLTGVDVSGGRPGLETFAHGLAGAAVDPFVEFPLLIFAEPVELRELEQLAAGDFVKAEPVNEPHPHAADEGPDAAVVIMPRQVQQIDRVIGAPVGVAGLHRRVQIGHGPGIVDADGPHELERDARAVHVEHVVRKARMFPSTSQRQLKLKGVISASR